MIQEFSAENFLSIGERQTISFVATSDKQLVCTTYNLPLLDEDWMIRRDMVYLVEKDRETAESCIYRASGMGLHKNVSIGNAYRIGKLGAKPLLGSTLLGEE